MRILQLHNHYQQSGGEDAVVASERSLLAKHGHDTRIYTLSSGDIHGLLKKLKTAWQVQYSIESRNMVVEELLRYKPDVVHVHNFFPLLTPSIYDACMLHGVPVVQTLHNYRTICPGALLMRGGHVCEDCVNDSAYQAILHGCYRGSYLGTLSVARMVQFHRKKGTWTNAVDRFIALSKFARDKFVQAGFPLNKICVKPNFYSGEFSFNQERKRLGALYVGRLSEEKGINTLLHSWSELDVPLTIIGDGPMSNLVQGSDNKLINYLGQRNHHEVREAMRCASYLVLPSVWYEGFPMVLVEAFANRLPVIASRLGVLKEVVDDRVTGLHLNPGDAVDLRSKIEWATENTDQILRMGMSAQEKCRKYYSEEVNYQELMKVYRGALSG